MTDVTDILAAAGVSVPEVDEYESVLPTVLEWSDSREPIMDAADAAILALAREVAKWRYVATHRVACEAYDRSPARIVPRFVEYPDDLGVLLARYAEEADNA